MKTLSKTNGALPSAILSAILCVLLDRVQLLAWPRGKRLPDIPGFSVERDSFVPQQTSIRTYRRQRTLRDHKSGTVIFLQYQPAPPWLAPLKITIVSETVQGHSRAELSNITAAFKRFRFLLVEFAMDFAPDSGVGKAFVLRHALFGKSEPQRTNQHATIRFGTRQSEIMARAYRRPDDSFRTELETHGGWLLRQHISKIDDLARLPALLLPKHMGLFVVDWQRLQAHLSREDGSSAARIVAECRERASSLHALLKHLRGDLGLQNVRRFLRPHPLHEQITTAALEWARRWKNNSETDDGR
jgi:hypothetical protein